jgi:uncharacterized NAD(P)/FAD-binding protein YdhS
VGGGFSGSLVAVNLARSARGRPIRILLFEMQSRVGRGAAYGTTCPQHLLNVPAGHMSALPDEPGHFLTWLQSRDPSATASTFASRTLYGEYIERLVRDAAAQRGVSLGLIQDEIVDIERRPSLETRMALYGRSGRLFLADEVVLALGNGQPRDPLAIPDAVRASGRYAANPWSQGALRGLAPDETLLLVGSGLTSADIVVEALAAGHKGPIVIVSRHGLLPQEHAPATRGPGAFEPGARSTLRELFKHLRSEAASQQAQGSDWRALIDAMRPALPTLWEAMDAAEKRRFVHHLAAFWDVHRHRIAPDVAATLRASIANRQLTVLAGRVVRLEAGAQGVQVTIVPRGKVEQRVLLAHRIVNCTGPARDIRVDPPSPVAALLARGECRPDPLAMGLDTFDDGALVSRDGRRSDHLYALGPLLKGRLWETTAVRELRVQAQALARHFLQATEWHDVIFAPHPIPIESPAMYVI